MGAILLAAGASTRMGTVKQLLPWKNSSLLEHSIEQLKHADVKTLVVVLGANETEIRQNALIEHADVVVNPDWEKGMATSIATGLRFLLKKRPELDRVLVALADQPLLGTKYYNKLIALSSESGNEIVSSSYSGQLGVPALFARTYFNNLLNLEGHQGARALIRGGQVKVTAVDAGELAVDLDTKEAYNRIYELYGRL